MWHTIRLRYHPRPFELATEDGNASKVLEVKVRIEPVQGDGPHSYLWVLKSVDGLGLPLADMMETSRMLDKYRAYAGKWAGVVVLRTIASALGCHLWEVYGIGLLGIKREDWDEEAKR